VFFATWLLQFYSPKFKKEAMKRRKVKKKKSYIFPKLVFWGMLFAWFSYVIYMAVKHG
jgi:membrane protein YqaA with SNARE-associated domain